MPNLLNFKEKLTQKIIKGNMVFILIASKMIFLIENSRSFIQVDADLKYL